MENLNFTSVEDIRIAYTELSEEGIMSNDETPVVNLKYVEFLEQNLVKAFEAGKQYVEQWIPVEKQEPPKHEKILVKTKFNEVYTFVFNSMGGLKTAEECRFNNIIEWRKI
mgnify:CR=1 FL=1